MLNGFTLIGDSQLKRYHANLGYHYRKRNIAYCYSGCTVQELRIRLKELPLIPDRVILLIGTNDLLRFTPLEDLKREYLALVKFLTRRVGWNSRIILITVPAIPRLQRNPEFWVRLNFLNRLIHSFASHPKITIVEVKTYEGTSLLKPKVYGGLASAEFFEKYFRDGREDLIHVNKFYFRDLGSALAKAFESITFEE